MNLLIRRSALPVAIATAIVASTFVAPRSQAADDGASLPPGEGRDAVAKVCSQCHGFDSIRKLRLSKDDWSDKIQAMVDNGATGTDQELAAVQDYLTRNFGTDSKIWMNTAPFAELKSVLKLTNAETDALIAYRTQSGPFHQWQDVSKAPGVDAKKVEAAKDKMTF